jgi:hypothetical protein
LHIARDEFSSENLWGVRSAYVVVDSYLTSAS